MLWSNLDYSKSFAPVEASEALLCWVYIVVSKCGGKTTVVFESVFSFNLAYPYEVIGGYKEGSVVLSSRFLFFFEFVSLANSIGHG